jgi:hypothetical protein
MGFREHVFRKTCEPALTLCLPIAPLWVRWCVYVYVHCVSRSSYLLSENLAQACAGDPRVLALTTRHGAKHAAYVRSLAATRIQRAFRAHGIPPMVCVERVSV